mmetsp:Transcript_34165/g.36914  ORF Transcript_34165/g.36914 Transcript_34165/m.36914 type:complete len:133 (+) Transcript_34165:567-965(+)
MSLPAFLRGVGCIINILITNWLHERNRIVCVFRYNNRTFPFKDDVLEHSQHHSKWMGQSQINNYHLNSVRSNYTNSGSQLVISSSSSVPPTSFSEAESKLNHDTFDRCNCIGYRNRVISLSSDDGSVETSSW